MPPSDHDPKDNEELEADTAPASVDDAASSGDAEEASEAVKGSDDAPEDGDAGEAGEGPDEADEAGEAEQGADGPAQAGEGAEGPQPDTEAGEAERSGATDIDDLVSETMKACASSLGRFRGESSFRTYIYGIARNVLRTHIRKAGRIWGQSACRAHAVHARSRSLVLAMNLFCRAHIY